MVLCQTLHEVPWIFIVKVVQYLQTNAMNHVKVMDPLKEVEGNEFNDYMYILCQSLLVE